MGITNSKWDASKYLDSPEMICEYSKTTLEEGGHNQLLKLLCTMNTELGFRHNEHPADRDGIATLYTDSEIR